MTPERGNSPKDKEIRAANTGSQDLWRVDGSPRLVGRVWLRGSTIGGPPRSGLWSDDTPPRSDGLDQRRLGVLIDILVV